MKHENQQTAKAYYNNQGVVEGGRFAEANEVLRKNVLPVLAKRARGRTLVAGWSPTLKFTPPLADQLVVADVAHNAVKHVPERSNLSCVCAEAAALPFDRGAFDTVFMLGLIHHLAEDNNAETDQRMCATMKEIARVMRRDSRLYILEPFVSSFFEVVNRIFFQPGRLLMNSRGLPMMCFFSVANFGALLDDAGLKIAYKTPIAFDGLIPASWFLPDIKVNPRWLPQKISLLEVHKKETA